MKDSLSEYSLESVKAATSQMTLEKAQVKAIFSSQGLSGAELDAAVKTATLSASQKGLTHTTTSLTTATRGLWTVLKAHPILTVVGALTVATTAYSVYKQ